jgi:hypothetical protein
MSLVRAEQRDKNSHAPRQHQSKRGTHWNAVSFIQDTTDVDVTRDQTNSKKPYYLEHNVFGSRVHMHPFISNEN